MAKTTIAPATVRKIPAWILMPHALCVARCWSEPMIRL